jgi:DNA-binding MarR family transcriptional regulator
VARQRAADDGRVVLVSISAEGRVRLDAVREQIGSLLHRTLRELDDADLAALVSAGGVLARLIESLQSAPAPV